MNLDALVNITDTIDTYMYTYFLVFLLIAAGIYFTIRTKGVQFTHIKDMFTAITEKKHTAGRRSVSSFQAMMVSTASRVGTGNIAGVATAIAVGGPGAVFWMWIMALINGSSAFVESTLAQIWKVRGDNGEFRGGPAYYIEQALGKRWLGIVFAVALIFCFALGFNGLQTYNMSSSIEYFYNQAVAGQVGAPGYFETRIPLVIGILLAIVFAFVLFGGTHRISFLTSAIVPAMAILYLVLAVIMAVMNASALPAVFGLIFSEAFNVQSLAGGFAGSMIVQGIKRGLFSNEAGMGSAPNAAAAASVSHPVKQGLVQTLSVFIDTIVICTCSAVMIMIFVQGHMDLTPFGGAADGLTNMPLVQQTMLYAFGDAGIIFMTVAIFAFAFSSLVGNYFYAEQNFRFITKSEAALNIFRVVCAIVVFFGAQLTLTLAWNLADIFMGIQAFINIVVIFILGKWAFMALEDYKEQKRQGLDPVYVADKFPGMPATECWHETREELPTIEENIVFGGSDQ
ncbi:MAG: alanine:cation symporter family protein [Eggerthellaceae bacterium]|nr:alanine:cation symporter family protein [Eggerthellaceae bacterium]